MDARKLAGAIIISITAALAASPASATLIGDSVDFTTATTGTTTFTTGGGGASGIVANVGAAIFTFCVGPNNTNCGPNFDISGGLKVRVFIEDGSTIEFIFNGKTLSATGSFSITISNIDDIINNVTGGLNSQWDIGTFALTSFDSHSITFTGTAGPGGYLHTGSAEYTIVSSIAVPEPATLTLIGVGLLGLGLTKRRRKPV